jgi:hypothetical protein
MQRILNWVDLRKQRYAEHPLFTYMRNTQIEPRQRLAFAPCMAHFIMSFADLNQHIWRKEPATNLLDLCVNEHTYEDDHHWPWFLADYQKLGFDQSAPFTNHLRFLWSNELKITRQLSYQLAAYTLDATSLQKLIAIEAIEATGNVLFDLTRQVAAELQAIDGREYQYFGHFHFQKETGHSRGSTDIVTMLEEMILTEADYQTARLLVDKVFDLFTAWADELLSFAKAHPVTTFPDARVPSLTESFL